MAIQTNNLAVGTASIGGATPDYTPPAFQWKSADELTIKSGRYYQGGYRLDGQYQDTTGLQSYWDVTTFDVDIDGASQIGGDVASSWYSVFLTAADAVVILPTIRVDALDYNVSNAGKTTLNPADHDDGTTANNTFVSANDVFNGYRLLLLSDTAYHGSLYTIEDSVDGTPDEIIIDGDVSAEIDAKAWLQMIPASGTSCVYLGSIRLDGSGNLVAYLKRGWRYQTPDNSSYVDAVKDTTPDNTDMAPQMPPTAKVFYGGVYSGVLTGGSGSGALLKVYSGLSGTNEVLTALTGDATTIRQNYRFMMPVSFVLSAVGFIRNACQYWSGAAWVAAEVGRFYVEGWEE
jgi:hypothetical protein